MKNVIRATAIVFLILLVFSCSHQEVRETTIDETSHLSTEKKKNAPQVIIIHEENLFPEGIEYDKRGDRFLLSSITRGSIGQVQDGEYSEWIVDEDLVSTLGIHIDHSGKRLLVTNTDIDGSLAALVAYDLSGERLFYTDLAGLRDGPHFANDVTVDQKGTAYVTDSFSGIIYEIDTHGNASVFYENEELDAAQGSFGLNGIDYDPRGYLLVSRLETNQILRFPIDNPDAYTEVEIPVELFSPDGLYLKNPNELLVVNNDQGGENASVQTFRTRDRWESATLIEEFPSPGVFTTTVTVKKNVPYVLYAHLDVLLSGGSHSEFSIVKAEQLR